MSDRATTRVSADGLSVAAVTADGLSLTVVRDLPHGTYTVKMDRRPTDGPWTARDVSNALAGVDGPLHTMRVGQRTLVRRVVLPRGWRVYLHVHTGPPTWWLPRARIKRNHVMVGWLRLLFVIGARRYPDGAR